MENNAQKTKMPLNTTFSKCAICGCFGIYIFYGVRSCEGCKQFFRRAVVNQKLYICWNQDKCNIFKGSRCRGCRLNKALLLGMDPRRLAPNGASEKFIERMEQRREALLQQQFITNLSEESTDTGLLKVLLHVEEAFKTIWDSSQGLPSSCTDRHLRLADLLGDSENLLASAKMLSKRPLDLWDQSKFIWQLENFGLYSTDIMTVTIKDWFLCVEFAKASLPFFRILELGDQINLLQSILTPISFFCSANYSHKISAKTFLRGDGFKNISLLKAKCFENDKNLEALCVQLFSNPVDRIAKENLDQKEFLLLLAIMFAHSAAPNLTVEGRDLLYAESIRYTKSLQRLTEEKYGHWAGAQKFSNLMGLLNVFYNIRQLTRKIGIYLEVFYTKQDAKIKFPSVLHSIFSPN